MSFDGATVGALAALGAAGMWATGTVLVGRVLRRSGPRPSAAAANFFKNGLAALMFGAGWALSREAAPGAGAVYALLWSGFLGFAVGDTLYFAAVEHCGAHLAAMLGNLAAPVAVLLSFLFLDETLSAPMLASMGVVIGGILLVLSDPARSGSRGVVHGRGARLAFGIGLGVLAGIAWGVSIAAGHAGFAGVGLMPGTSIRLAGGLGGAAALAVALDLGRAAAGVERAELGALTRPFRDRGFARLLLVPAFFAALLTLPLHSTALREAPGGVAAVLFATTPLTTLPIAFALGERTGWRTSLGTLVGFAGVAGVILLGGEPEPEPGAARTSAEPPRQDAAAEWGTLRVHPVESRAAPRSGLSNLARGADGELYHSWVEHGPERLAILRFARWEGDGLGAPREIARGHDWLVNWADFPGVAALAGGELIASWLQRSEAGGHAYDARYAVSGDGGATWSEPAILHSDRHPEEHGFVSFVPLDARRFGALWLDGRHLAEPGGAMALFYRTVAADGALGPETEVDGRVCDCCQTALALARGADGEPALLAAWRDRGDDERRDTSFAELRGGAWSAPRDVFADGWIHHQCPVNGPSLGARDGRRAVVWYTEGGGLGGEIGAGTPRVRLAFGTDGAGGFGPPVTVDEGAPLGRADLVLLADGSALVLWLEAAGERGGEELAAWRARLVAPDSPAGKGGARLGPACTVATVPATRRSGFARLALLSDGEDDGALVTWTVTGPEGGVRLARIER